MVAAGRHRAEQSIQRSRFVCTLERVRNAAEAQAFVRDMNLEFRCDSQLLGVCGGASPKHECRGAER